MENAFQELDYSDISAKNINRKEEINNVINTKTKGGIVRLLIFVVISLVVVGLIVTIISKSRDANALNRDIEALKSEIEEIDLKNINNEEIITKLQNQISSVQKEIETTTKELSQKQRSISEIKDKIRETEDNIEKLNRDISSKEREITYMKGVKSKYSELKEEKEYYKKLIEEAKK